MPYGMLVKIFEIYTPENCECECVIRISSSLPQLPVGQLDVAHKQDVLTLVTMGFLSLRKPSNFQGEHDVLVHRFRGEYIGPPAP